MRRDCLSSVVRLSGAGSLDDQQEFRHVCSNSEPIHAPNDVSDIPVQILKSWVRTRKVNQGKHTSILENRGQNPLLK
jgi:hypothetical protein